MKNFIKLTFILFALLFFISTAIMAQGVNVQEKNAKINWEYQVAYQRGFEVINWSFPAVSMLQYREGHFNLGGGYNTIYYTSIPTDSLSKTVSTTVFISVKNGPVIIDIPTSTKEISLSFSAKNIWQKSCIDDSNGKYLFTPLDYKGETPNGYTVVSFKSNTIIINLMATPSKESNFQEAVDLSKQIHAYSFDQFSHPPKRNFINLEGKQITSTPDYNLSYFDKVTILLNEEPLQENDKIMEKMLLSIGLQKEKIFTPKVTVKKALEKAIKDRVKYIDYIHNKEDMPKKTS
ncbi:DUF1254 domain-containing protein [Flammeovirga pectinis]|uniref:DUF1254 domain-containing protein n=1 Tax=Flammeovirga pectinis TaxID=2494373 RepID=A0A3S9NY91_9BACT|nr:DUF1254 domain-containing protein [Flammeovirga pectinis]AZQ60894.1 DUF1254 domain-containing protein [Flammeovirga pectinis]